MAPLGRAIRAMALAGAIREARRSFGIVDRPLARPLSRCPFSHPRLLRSCRRRVAHSSTAPSDAARCRARTHACGSLRRKPAAATPCCSPPRCRRCCGEAGLTRCRCVSFPHSRLPLRCPRLTPLLHSWCTSPSPQGLVAGRLPGLSKTSDPEGYYTYTRPEGKRCVRPPGLLLQSCGESAPSLLRHSPTPCPQWRPRRGVERDTAVQLQGRARLGRGADKHCGPGRRGGGPALQEGG